MVTVTDTKNGSVVVMFENPTAEEKEIIGKLKLMDAERVSESEYWAIPSKKDKEKIKDGEQMSIFAPEDQTKEMIEDNPFLSNDEKKEMLEKSHYTEKKSNFSVKENKSNIIW